MSITPQLSTPTQECAAEGKLLHLIVSVHHHHPHLEGIGKCLLNGWRDGRFRECLKLKTESLCPDILKKHVFLEHIPFLSYGLTMTYSQKPSLFTANDSAPLGMQECGHMSYLQKASVYLLEEAEPEMRGCWAPTKATVSPKGRLRRTLLVAPELQNREAGNQTRTAAS